MRAPEPSSALRKHDILQQALKRKTLLERAAFLDGACGGDAALRAEMETLLANQAADQRGAALNADGGGVNVEGATTEVAPTVLDQTPETEQPATVIGRYKLIENLGEGGFGTVWLAEQKEPVRRQVALKIIKLGMDTRQVVARFEAERQALALMNHPNIAKVFDAGTTDNGRPFFVMELVKGIPITRYCDQEELRTTERLKLFMTICQAIQHAHQKGIIHRDIKPSNILVTLQEGAPVPKVIDFGIAKATQQRLTDKTLHTQLEQFIGTPSYMSPEQAEMSGLDIDTRSDIYSLGVLLYELLTGKTPFDAKELMAAGLDEMRRTIREKEPMRPSTRLGTLVGKELTTTAQRRRADAPKLISLLRGDLDWIVMRCLEKDRTRRYDTANGLAMDIQRHLENEPVLARPPSNIYRFQKLARRNKVAFAGASAVAVALVLGAVVSTWQAIRATRSRQQAEANEQKAEKAQQSEAQLREQAQAQELAARRRAYASDMNLAQHMLSLNNLGAAQELLNRHRPAAPSEIPSLSAGGQNPRTGILKSGNPSSLNSQPSTDLRGWEWRYLWQQCQSDPRIILCKKKHAITSLAVSHDGQWLAVSEEYGGELSLWDIRDLQRPQEILPLKAGEGGVLAAFSPTENLLAFSIETGLTSSNSQDAVQLWEVMTRRVVATLPLSGACAGLAFSEDGRTLATSTFGGDGKLTLWRVPDGKKLVSHEAVLAGSIEETDFAMTRDMSVAAHATSDGKLRLVDLATGKERWIAEAADEDVKALAFSPDGKVLASGAGYVESTIRLWDVASGKLLARLEGHRAWVAGLMFWPDGKTLASASGDQTIRLWDIANLTNAPARQILRGHQREVWRVALLPDHKTLISGSSDGSVYAWDTAARRREQTLGTFPDVRTWRFAPDSKSVLIVDTQGRVAERRGTDFQKAVTLQEIGSGIEGALISEDGRLLAAGFSNGVVRVWNLSEGNSVREFVPDTGTVHPLHFLGKGKSLVIWCLRRGSMLEWDLGLRQEARFWLPPSKFWHLSSAVSPDERWCLSVGAMGASVLKDMATGRETNPHFDLHEPWGLAFSHDGKLFAIASGDGFAKVFATDTLLEVATLSGFLLGIHGVAFSPDDTRLATGGDGQEAIRLWDTKNNRPLVTLEGRGSLFSSAAFSPDGSVLGAMNGQGVLHLWRAPSWAEIDSAEKAQVKTQ